MPRTSFNAILDRLKSDLAANSDIAAYCEEKWGRPLTVRRVFRNRTEIALAELPIILITAPQKVPGRFMNDLMESVHTVRLYCGFQQPDREKAQEELAGFEEAVEDAILSYKKNAIFPTGVEDIRPGESVNDEGRRPPVYFFVKDVEIDFIRSI